MEDFRLLKISLTQDQKRRLTRALEDLMRTIINVAAETGISFEEGGRLLVMSLTMETISRLASVMNEALNKYTEEIARRPGAEPSP